MIKKLAFALLLLFLSCSTVNAQTKIYRNSFTTVFNPVRGYEDWHAPSQTPLDLPLFLYKTATPAGIPVSWGLRFDAVDNASVSAFFEKISKNDSQELAAFLEVTPNFAKLANVPYPDGAGFFSAKRIFLSGYSQEDRIKLIDTYMNAFFTRFGYYPKTVAAWHIDAYSLDYLKSKYSILAAVICDDQYSTDRYRLWGGYIGSPYYPSKTNFLVPGSNRHDRLDLVIVKWAPRDFFNFYGPGKESLYSFQVNDYSLLGLSNTYFRSLLEQYNQSSLNEVSQFVIGLENDYSLKLYQESLKQSYLALKTGSGQLGYKIVKLSEFANWFLRNYPEGSPTYFFKSEDPTKKKAGTVYWYFGPKYRLGLKTENGQTKIFDFRLYHQNESEDYYAVQNLDDYLFAETPALIDTVKNSDSALTLPIDLEKAVISYENWRVTFKVGDSSLNLQPERLVFTNLTPPDLNSPEVKLTKTKNQTTWNLSPKIPNTSSRRSLYLLSALVLLIIFNLKRRLPPKPFLLLLGLLCAVPVITMFRSGSFYNFGMGFYGPNGHDAVFHLSIIESLKNNLSLQHPQFAGIKLQNYHFGYDFIVAFLSKLSGLSSLDLYFRFLPACLTILLATLVYLYLRSFKLNRFAIFFGLFLTLLGGSLGFIATFLKTGNIWGGESLFWSHQSVSFLLNPPFALSLVLLVTFFILNRNQTKYFWVLVLIGALLSQVKIYAFILLCLSLFFARQFKLTFLIALLGGVISAFFLKANSPSPFIFEPLWFLRSMVDANDRLGWFQLAQAWQTFENSGNFLKVFLINIFCLFIFIVGNYSSRLLGLWEYLKSKPETNLIKWIGFWGLLLPLLFTQAANPWNTIQFLYYSLFVFNLLSAFTLDRLIKNHRYLGIFIGIVLMLLSLPTTIGTIRDYLSYRSSSRISFSENRALTFLKTQPKGIVLSAPFDQRTFRSYPDPRPLYAYTSTAYISAFSGRPEFLSDLINLNITSVPFQDRLNNVQRFFNTHDTVWAKKFLSENQIRYVYLNPSVKLNFDTGGACLKQIYQSGEINLYEHECL